MVTGGNGDRMLQMLQRWDKDVQCRVVTGTDIPVSLSRLSVKKYTKVANEL